MQHQNTMIFCTLFDSNYLDKGLALYSSMRKSMEDFKLYIFAFDARCYEVLTDMQLENVVVLSLDDIMSDELSKLQKERNRAEFCWTCTSVIIEHVLLKCDESICTYVDADIYFFSSPRDEIRKMLDEGCSVGIVAHGYERNYEYGRKIFECGKYCVEFNTFVRDEAGLRVLQDWKRDCFEWCYYRYQDGMLGDQRYLDKWEQKYDGVYVFQNQGMGIAPWNLHTYSEMKESDGRIFVKRDEECVAVFYHFEGMKYIKEKCVFLNVWRLSDKCIKKRIKLFYENYFKEINAMRKALKEKYHITFSQLIVEKRVVLREDYSIKAAVRNWGCIEGVKVWYGSWRNGIMHLNG